jgi:hypothetical protein
MVACHDGRALSRAFVIRVSVLSFGCFSYTGSHSLLLLTCDPSPRPLSLPLESFSLEIDRWRRAAAPAADLPWCRGSACLQQVHSTAGGNSGPGVAG